MPLCTRFSREDFGQPLNYFYMAKFASRRTLPSSWSSTLSIEEGGLLSLHALGDFAKRVSEGDDRLHFAVDLELWDDHWTGEFYGRSFQLFVLPSFLSPTSHFQHLDITGAGYFQNGGALLWCTCHYWISTTLARLGIKWKNTLEQVLPGLLCSLPETYPVEL